MATEPADVLGDVLDGLVGLDASLGAAAALLGDLPQPTTARETLAHRAVVRLVERAAAEVSALAQQAVDLNERVVAVIADDDTPRAAA